MKKYIYSTLFIFFAGFLISFFSSYYYFYEKYTSKTVVKKEEPYAKETKETKETSELTKTDNVEKLKDKPLYAKEVFLTIDDGPSSNNTLKNLKTLERNGVKATFFVIGKQAEKLPEIIKGLNDSGMSIVNHSYSHDYDSYKSEETCLNDFARCDSVLFKLLNKNPLKFIRFPGGSDNQVSKKEVMAKIRKDVVAKGLYYVDWNVSAGDAEPKKIGSKDIINNIMNQCKNRKFVVVLVHDAEDKKNTAEALDKVIKDLKSQGFIFRTFEDITPTEIKEMLNLKILNRGA